MNGIDITKQTVIDGTEQTQKNHVKLLISRGFQRAAEVLKKTNLDIGFAPDTYQIIFRKKKVEVRGFRSGRDNQAYRIK